MRLKTLAVFVPVFALIGATALAWHQYRELVVLRAKVLGGDDRAALEAKLAAFAKRNVELEAQLMALRNGRNGNEASDAADATRDPDAQRSSAATALLANLALADNLSPESKADAEMEILAAMADLPEFQKLMALQQRGKIDSKYAALFRKLHLTADQQAQLERLLGDKQSAYADAMIAAHDQGLTGKDARQMANTVAKATQKDIEASIKSLLGTQGYNQYQNYEHTLPQRDTVNQLAQRLSYTPTPLNARQQEQLVQALATGLRQTAAEAAAAVGAVTTKAVKPVATVAPLPGPLSSLGSTVTNSGVITPVAISKAQSFLSPQQITALQQMQQEQQAQQMLNQLIRTGGGKTGGSVVKAPKPGKG